MSEMQVQVKKSKEHPPVYAKPDEVWPFVNQASPLLEDEFLTAPEFMRLCSIKHKLTVYELIKHGLPVYKVGKNYRFSTREVLNFLRPASDQ